MVVITRKTNIPKLFKLPRKEKKAFKLFWVGIKTSITIDYSKVGKGSNEEIDKVLLSWTNILYDYYKLYLYPQKGIIGKTIKTY